MVGVQRHLLDDAQLIAVVEAEPQQWHRVVEPGLRVQHGVHLHRRQTRRGRRGEPVEYVGEPVAAGDLRESVGIDGVERDVDAVESGGLQPGRAPRQPDSVGGQRDLGPRIQGGGCCDGLLEMSRHQWFAAGEAHAGHAEPGDGDAEQPGQFVLAQQRLAGQPVQTFGGHAVRAP